MGTITCKKLRCIISAKWILLEAWRGSAVRVVPISTLTWLLYNIPWFIDPTMHKQVWFCENEIRGSSICSRLHHCNIDDFRFAVEAHACCLNGKAGRHAGLPHLRSRPIPMWCQLSCFSTRMYGKQNYPQHGSERIRAFNLRMSLDDDEPGDEL